MLSGWKWTSEDEQGPQEPSERDVAGILEEEQKKNAQRYKVPVELEATYTPAEVEQMQELFDELDVDGSGTIDLDELKVAFDKLEETVSEDQLKDLLDEYDNDGSGCIDFGEFLHLFASFKSGNSKFSKLSKLFDKVDATPLKILEMECQRRGLKVKYRLVDVMEPTSMHPAQFIMAADISGVFKELTKDGRVSVGEETRSYQGIGKNTRAAKFASATVALSKLREYIPGIDYEPGVIPEEWMDWFERNIDMGVDEMTLLEKLTVKGFFPCKNVIFMQRLSLRVSMRKMQEESPQIWPSMEGRTIPVEWEHWAKYHMKRGIHGEAILKCLVENGFVPERNPLLAASLKKDEGGAFSDKVRSKTVDFWSCAATGEVFELRRYITGGQDPNELTTISGYEISALALAIKNQQVDACQYLVGEAGAEINSPDSFGRVATHLAAIVGSLEILEYIISQGGDVVRPDKYGDTPLHLAATRGHVDIVIFLADWYEGRLRRFFSGKDVLKSDHETTFLDTAKYIYDHVLATRLPPFAAQLFRKVWVFYGLQEYCKTYDGIGFAPKVETRAKAVKEVKNDQNEEDEEEKDEDEFDSKEQKENDPILDFIDHRDPKANFFFPTPSQQMVQGALKQYDRHPNKDYFETFDEFVDIFQKLLTNMWLNMTNIIGRTPLMCAIDQPSGEISENHQKIMRCLLDEHACDVHIKDNYGKDAIAKINGHLQNLGEAWVSHVEAQAARRKAEEEKEREAMLEPLMTDPLYTMMEEAGQIRGQWKLMLARSCRLKEVADYFEMFHEKTKTVFYCDAYGNCQWSKPSPMEDHDRIVYGWNQMKVQSKRLDSFQKWDIYIHVPSGQRFHHNYETNEFSWVRPNGVKRKKGDRPVHEPEKATMLSKLGFWSKWQRTKDKVTYFVNEKHKKCQYERPMEWSAYADGNAQVNSSPERCVEDWTTMQVGSDLNRVFDHWEERKEFTTGAFFYWDTKNKAGQWSKPRYIMSLEQGMMIYAALRGREGGRVRKKLQVVRSFEDHDNGIDWNEEKDLFKDTNTNNKNVEKNQIMSYFVGKHRGMKEFIAQGKKPSVLVEMEEEEKRKIEERMPRFVDPTQIRRRSSVFHLTRNILTPNVMEKGERFQRMLLWVEAAEERQSHGYMLCSWGCKDWIEPDEVERHRNEKCKRRQLPCELGCPLVLRAEQWDELRTTHLECECPKRKVACRDLCGEWVVFEEMDHHLTNICLKRPMPPIKCQNECGWAISGGLEDEETMKWETEQHETYTCPKRIVRCDWPRCMAEMEARNRPIHRQEHLHKVGIITWTTAGTYKWRVPRRCKTLLVHGWGGGGGSGMLKGRRGGNGGGGGFVEAELRVYPKEELIIVVGAGGGANMDAPPERLIGDDENIERISQGGYPGGGNGVSRNYTFSCGGGGGYSAILRQGAYGEELLFLVAGGGGGGTRDGSPGGDEKHDPIDFDGIQRNGGQGTQNEGGNGGNYMDTGVPSEPGKPYQGGSGGEFGGGGGGGIFGGGGGGYTPGVIGGGGGGSNFVYRESALRVKMIPGNGPHPGGKDYDLPAATGLGDWDLTGKFAGYGGFADKNQVNPGSSGAIRIKLPRYFDTKLPESRLDIHDIETERNEDDETASCLTCQDTQMDGPETTTEHLQQLAQHHDVVPGEPNNHDDELFDEDQEEQQQLEVEEEEDDVLDPEIFQEEPDPYELLVPGARVKCYYNGKRHNPQYTGVIADTNNDGTFEIEYDDGDYDTHIPPEFITIL